MSFLFKFLHFCCPGRQMEIPQDHRVAFQVENIAGHKIEMVHDGNISSLVDRGHHLATDNIASLMSSQHDRSYQVWNLLIKYGIQVLNRKLGEKSHAVLIQPGQRLYVMI